MFVFIPDYLCPAVREEHPVLPGHHVAVAVLVLTEVEPGVWLADRPAVVVGHAGRLVVAETWPCRRLLWVVGAGGGRGQTE